jgi:hypothetical protein
MKEITVRITKNFGQEAIYPVDEAAQTFARLTGTKTFSRQAIEHIKALGFGINVEQVAL